MVRPRRERLEPTAEQMAHARDLLARVPVHSHDWGSDQGQAFLSYVDGLVGQGVPASWLASELELSQTRLYGMLARYRQGRS